MWRTPAGDEAGRECWWIMLPMEHPELGVPGHPSRLCWLTTDRASEPPHQMWDVSGTPPLITVSPSIDVLRYVKRGDEFVREGSYWHGWIRDGIMSPA